jgi:antibiotic biosynthesis monooxygenase (ABM) superfamily enzyme
MELSMTVAVASSPAAVPAPRFSRPRFALLILAGVYPLVTVLLYAIFPLTEGWSLWQRTLVLVPIIVVSMVWGIIPAIHRRFHGFVNPVR